MIHRIGSAALALLLFALAAPPAFARAHRGPTILVVGGTPAGVAAAVAAARRGADVTLVARRHVLGGVLTDAMMDQWDLNLAPDGRTVEGGIFREVYAELGDSFTPQQAARAFGELVAREPRIRLITDARAIAVTAHATGSRRTIDTVTFANPNGRAFTLAASAVIDATDNGDVAAQAGARFTLGRQDTGRDERMQPVTLMFTLEGVTWPAVVATYGVRRCGPGGATERRAWGYSRSMTDYRPLSPDVLVRDLNFGHESGGNVTVNAIDVLGVDGRSDTDLARARSIAEREAPNLLAYLRATLPGFAGARIGRFADAIYVRETRHFAGLEHLSATDVWRGRIPPDTIGLSSYPLDLHPATADERSAFAPVRHVYGIPLGSMIPRGFANVILASPAISASHIASGSARVIPTTIEEGEAAGAAAAQANARHIGLDTLATQAGAVAALRDDLQDHGVILGV